jgi:hypothetical protein
VDEKRVEPLGRDPFLEHVECLHDCQVRIISRSEFDFEPFTVE